MSVLGPDKSSSTVSLCDREVEAFVYREAHLLDQGSFDQWLSLFADESVYWIDGEHDDPRQGISLVYDNKRHLEERILRMQAGKAASQSPLTMTTHIVSAVLLEGGAPESGHPLRCVSKQVIHYARGDRSGALPATVQHTIGLGGSGYLIQSKRVSILTRSQPMPDLSFLL